MTPQPAIIRNHLRGVSYGDTVPMCKQCLAVRVSEAGRLCPGCVQVTANRDAMEADLRTAKMYATRAAIVVSIIVLGVIVAALIEW